MEHGTVGGVYLVLPVNAAGGNDADGRLAVFHHADLHGRGLGAEQDGIVLGGVEGVLTIPGGMTGGGVEFGEVVALQLYLRALDHVKAHADEDFLHLVEHNAHGMLMTHRNLFGGHGHVYSLHLELPIQGCSGQGCLLLLQGCLNGGTNLVGLLTHHRALLGGKGAHLFEQCSEFTLFSQKTNAQVFQLSGFFCFIQSCQRHFFNVFQLLFHVAYSLSNIVSRWGSA